VCASLGTTTLSRLGAIRPSSSTSVAFFEMFVPFTTSPFHGLRRTRVAPPPTPWAVRRWITTWLLGDALAPLVRLPAPCHCSIVHDALVSHPPRFLSDERATRHGQCSGSPYSAGNPLPLASSPCFNVAYSLSRPLIAPLFLPRHSGM